MAILLISLVILTVYIFVLKNIAIDLLTKGHSYNSNKVKEKIKKVKLFIAPIIIILIILSAWKAFLPENYYSLKRLFGSNEKLLNKTLNKESFKNEVEALVTYGSIPHDINVLYKAKLDDAGNILELKLIPIKLNAHTLVKVFDVKQPVKSYEGQGFIEIQIQNQNGSYVNSPRYWIEADYISIVTPNDISSKDKDKIEIEKTDNSYQKLNSIKYDELSVFNSTINREIVSTNNMSKIAVVIESSNNNYSTIENDFLSKLESNIILNNYFKNTFKSKGYFDKIFLGETTLLSKSKVFSNVNYVALGRINYSFRTNTTLDKDLISCDINLSYKIFNRHGVIVDSNVINAVGPGFSEDLSLKQAIKIIAEKYSKILNKII
ncbi:MAG: hypothetical protein A2440_13185 [Stygiobacter sp. RIFOXYC2_FULL_38_25]|nr:MAG: hypothetical protein A2299_02805 [Stygiobacter sp. RIFOXYB2_FULL_37_11]OGV13275.1 MAG: hypothetical protein A2440_13185 [Stygiobacter sp. RIFOXYC2_FULL_38_25]